MKAIEIERKFLVRDDSWRNSASCPRFLQQAYLYGRDQGSVRVRLVDGCSARLTIKFRTTPLTKEEYEYEIPVEEARGLLLHAAGHILEKTRYSVAYDGRNWDVDVFAGAHDGLTLAEIEMTSEEEAFSRPPWLGREVTGNKRYSNRSMADALRLSPVA